MLAALTAVMLLGWADYLSGPDIGFSLLYLAPVIAVGWLDGALPAAGIALAASLAWFQADYLWQHTTLGVTAWNSFTRLAIFVSMGILMARLRRERERLRAANEELESFTYSVSHDLRTPLLHIGSFAQMLDKGSGTRLDDEGRRYVATISDSAAVALKLIDDLLGFAHLGKMGIRRSPVDLLLLDVRMPKMDGLEVLKKLKADPATKRIPVVLLTSSRQEQDMLGAYALKADDYVVKPARAEQLAAVIARALQRAAGPAQ